MGNKYADKCPLKITLRKPKEIQNKEAGDDDDTPEPPENPTLQAEQEAAEALAAGGNGDEDAEYEYYDEKANANDAEYEYYDEEEENIMNQVGGDDADGYEE